MPTSAAPRRLTRWTWLLLSFTRRELSNRYAGSVWGASWTLLHPLAQLGIYAYVFSQVFRISVPAGYPGVGYVTFVTVALWPWIMFSEGVQRAMGSIVGNAGLVRKVAFPHRLLVFAALLSSCAVHCAGFIAVLLALRLFGEPVRLLHLPVALALLVPYMLFAAGVGAFLAALQTLLRDVEQALNVVLALLFYASPILYPTSMLPAPVDRWMALSPLAWFSERMRDVLLRGDGLVAGDIAMTAACVAVFLAGLWFFERLSPHFEDFL